MTSTADPIRALDYVMVGPHTFLFRVSEMNDFSCVTNMLFARRGRVLERRRGTRRPAALLGVAVPAAGPKPRREAGALQLQAAADPPQVGDDVDLAGFGVGVPTHRPPQVGRLLVVPGSLRESKLMVFVEQLQYFL